MISWKLRRKARSIIEREQGTVRKPWGGKISICLIYPNSYYVGMSNLGFQTLYHLFNIEDDVVCERSFLPDPEDLQEHYHTQTPLFSLESQKPISDFDILAFSVSFEIDFLNILTILDLARIPMESQFRKDGHPLIFAGGVAVFLNPEPISPFFDLFFLGEAEEAIGEFLEVYRNSFAERGKRTKDNLLRRLSRVEGMYVPKFYHITYAEDGKIETMEPEPGFPRRIKRRWVKEIDRFPIQSTLFTPTTEFNEMALVEVSRGCPRRCRFCAACFVYHPFRNHSLPILESLLKESLSKAHRIGLTGAAISDFPQLIPLCRAILSQQGGISLSSLRVDRITSPLVQCLKEGGNRTVAIAPEAGSERLREVLGKGYTEDEVLKAIDTLIEHGLSQIKCYFLIGLPSETDEDVKEILHLVKWMRHHILSTQKNKRGNWSLILSVNPFIPKPATPLQWLPLEEVGRLKRKLKILKRGIQGEKGMEIIHDLPKWAYIQALLSRGDRRVGKILMAAHKSGGDWNRSLREMDINPDFYVYRRRDLDEIFPWDFIDHGTPKEKLMEEYFKAMKEAGITLLK